ncbi:acetyl-CoA C-acetyltransferase [Malassezia yamatoensis]|uniref:acetyl-CoA C-acetyltransferase n=1 Tax=Malassezia yamatoensis TaxID=253288 RepID=A0AAJ6CI50_9BASI|nr:acetyl-CoA C-acetyltransferase [Malassezia yamatoensis]
MVMSVYIVSAVRTPVGSFQGSLKTQSATDLGTAAAVAAIERAKIEPEHVEEAYLGCVLQANAGQAPARQVVLRAKCPDTTEATTVNKVCASGMKSVAFATQAIQLGERDVMLAGGMESMSQTPYYMPRNGLAFGDVTAKDSILRDGLTDALSQDHMGLCAENTAKEHNISRQAQDQYAIQSYERAADAWASSAFNNEIVPITIKDRKGETVVSEDEEYKKLNKDKISTLRSAFQKDGTVTAANASSLNDGASALILASEDAVKKHQLKPLARILATADAARKPVDFPIAPALAIPRALERAKVTKDQIALWEINEAFSVVALANMQILDLDPSKVNVHGGGVSLGHPIGSSGSRIIVSLVHALKQGDLGVASVCNGGGGASAIVVELSLADKFRAWQEEEQQGSTQNEESQQTSLPSGSRSTLEIQQNGLGACADNSKPSYTSDWRSSRASIEPASSEDEVDYMSDGLLSQLETQDSQRQLSYAEKRAKVLREQQENQRREMDAANARRAKRQRGPLEGEEEARQIGMAVNVMERAETQQDREAPQIGCGTEAAIRIMRAMGYEPGTSLGRDQTIVPKDPIFPDQRWLSRSGDQGPRRLGLGHHALSQQIAQATTELRYRTMDMETQADHYRMDQAKFAAEKHLHGLLRQARKICRELDEENGLEVSWATNVQYSPLWLDPSALPEQHTLHQESLVKGNERGEEDARNLLAYALYALEQDSIASQGLSSERMLDDHEHCSVTQTQHGPESRRPDENFVPAGRSSSETPTLQTAQQRHIDAERFCALPVAVRLELTKLYLGETYAFCLYCGHRYTTYDQMLAECPGDTEAAHE